MELKTECCNDGANVTGVAFSNVCFIICDIMQSIVFRGKRLRKNASAITRVKSPSFRNTGDIATRQTVNSPISLRSDSISQFKTIIGSRQRTMMVMAAERVRPSRR